MFSTLLTIALFVAPAIQGVFAEFAINTPALTQCKDAKISWEATKGPYNLIVVKAEDPCGDALADLGDHTTTTLTWKAALPAGTKVQLSLEDANGDEAWSGTITVDKGDDASCIPANLVQPNAETKTPATANTPSGSTLVITPTTTVQQPATTSDSPAPVGAANAGSNPLGINSNGALTMRQASAPVMVLGAIAAVVALAL